MDRPGFPTKYLRAAGLLLLLTVGAAVTAAAGAAAGAATALGLHGLSARLISIAVGSILGRAYFLAAYRIATPARVPTRSMLPGAAISAVAWQLLLMESASSPLICCATPTPSQACSAWCWGCSHGSGRNSNGGCVCR